MYLTLPWASVLKGMQFLNTVIDAEKSKKVQLYTLQLFLDNFNKNRFRNTYYFDRYIFL